MSICLHILSASLTYKKAVAATFENLNLTLPAGSVTCLLGPSGCGKTSLLRLIAGLIDIEHSQFADIRCSDDQPLNQRFAYMAQQDLLLPWLNVVDNICLKERLLKGKISHSGREAALDLLRQLDLCSIADALPEQLSGGMRQRVALARTLMQDTPVVLMDEPFSSLDAVNRYKLQDLSSVVLEDRTVLLITHDPQEALRLSDQLFIFDDQNKLINFPLPRSATPRAVNAELGEYQQKILDQLRVQHA
jgi:putative hydroxymethylpyrimidine transport system ATP-binding protein